jgi:hypothetical protein
VTIVTEEEEPVRVVRVDEEEMEMDVEEAETVEDVGLLLEDLEEVGVVWEARLVVVVVVEDED